MKIRGRAIALGAQPFIIAEIGVNHDGDLNRAIELVEAAATAGADAVKVQCFKANTLLSLDAQLASYQRSSGESDAHSMLQRLELDIDSLGRIAKAAHALDLAATCTVFTPELVQDAEGINFDAYKVASPDLVNRMLVECLAATGRPLILSTGAATIDEIARTIGWVSNATDHLACMHCVSSYPTPESEATLACVRTIGERFGLPSGYSDHTAAIDTGALAVAAGACILEKHLTHSRAAAGPDHASSLEPDQFADYVCLAHRAHTMLGDGAKLLRPIEAEVRNLSRQSLSVSAPVKQGETIIRSHLTTRRPGSGIAACSPEIVIGRTATRALAPGEILREEDLA